jgi:hypothetical protein
MSQPSASAEPIMRTIPGIAGTANLYVRNPCGRCARRKLTDMNRLPKQTGGGRKHARQRKTEVRIQVSWCWRLSGPAAARLLIVLVLVLAGAAVATPANDELARGALYCLAGFLTGSRPRLRP